MTLNLPKSSEEWLKEQRIRLYNSTDWREFVESYWPILKKKPCRLNHAELSRKAKYSSRGYLHEILKRKKSTSKVVALRLAEALKLAGSDRQLFLLLSKKEYDTEKVDISEVERNISELKDKLNKQTQITVSKNSISQIFSGYHVFTLYAALGSSKSGSSLSDLVEKTNLSSEVVQEILSKLISVECLKKENDKYFLTNNTLDFSDLGSHVGFRESFLWALEEIKQRANKMESLPQDLYFHTAIPIPRGSQSLLRTKLRELIMEFADSSDQGVGDEIVHINLALYKN